MTTGKSNFDYMDLCQQSGDSAFNALSRFVISLARPQASWWPRLQGLAPRRLRLSFVFITSWEMEGENVEAVTDFLFLASKITVDGDCSHEIRR